MTVNQGVDEMSSTFINNAIKQMLPPKSPFLKNKLRKKAVPFSEMYKNNVEAVISSLNTNEFGNAQMCLLLNNLGQPEVFKGYMEKQSALRSDFKNSSEKLDIQKGKVKYLEKIGKELWQLQTPGRKLFAIKKREPKGVTQTFRSGGKRRITTEKPGKRPRTAPKNKPPFMPSDL